MEMPLDSPHFPKPSYNFSWISSVNQSLIQLSKEYCHHTVQGIFRVTDELGFFRYVLFLKLELWKRALELAKLKAQLDVLSATSVFEFCSARCRTSSESVVNTNAYRDPKHRFCFGIDPPELKLMSNSGNTTL
ncbi:unnamed protein product [Hydatigera taeniaeformis]|uniref:SREBP regulating gene protein n=1 Tax=Hydatigena taeniaeformis TaxID=6205 RepID=A0A0R3X291_HYDTA|nr:unnamed protein product [Hydatigera taeniaeformis]